VTVTIIMRTLTYVVIWRQREYNLRVHIAALETAVQRVRDGSKAGGQHMAP